MTDWETLSDSVLAVLVWVRRNRAAAKLEARQRGLTVDQMTAAAITELVADHVQKKEKQPRRNRRKAPKG